jgi:hypothetical protein
MPSVAKLAVELKWLTTQLEPGDIKGFLHATSLLCENQGNLLLHWILCLVKFPSAMHWFAHCFATLPADFAAKELQVSCHSAILRWQENTSKRQVAQEKKLYHTDHMDSTQGVVDVMQRLGLMHRPSGKHLPSKQHGTRVGRHIFCYSASVLTKYVQLMGTHQVDIEGSLDKGGLMSAVDCWMEILAQMPPLARVCSPDSGDITIHRLYCRAAKLRHRIGKKCRDPRLFLQTGHIVEHTRFTQMNALWLVKHHESRQSLDVNWEQMTMKEMVTIVPDQDGHLATLGKLRLSIGTFAGWTGDHPLTISSTLGFLGCLTAAENSYATEALTNPRNRAMLESMVIIHKAEFQGIAPTFKLLINAALQSTNAYAVREQQCSGSSVSEARLAMRSLMVEQASEAAGTQTPCMSSTQKEEKGEASVPEKDHSWKAIILPVSGRGHQMLCKCAGNCRPGCPARGGNECSNKVMRKKGNADHLLCESCTCTHPGCKSGARRPHGREIRDSNYGMCKAHWLKK